MLVKYLSICLLSASMVLAPPAATAQEVYEGGWADGAVFLWQCGPKTQGAVKFMFVTPEGKQYTGVLSCGQSV